MTRVIEATSCGAPQASRTGFWRRVVGWLLAADARHRLEADMLALPPERLADMGLEIGPEGLRRRSPDSVRPDGGRRAPHWDPPVQFRSLS